MDWVEGMSAALDCIEANLEEELDIARVARCACVSPFYFQRAFAILCGYTVGEYVRRRRLSLAGGELLASEVKIIELAFKYGYDSPDSFTRAFTRFHGVTPTAVRRDGAAVKSFAPLRIKLILEGGTIMEYKIVQKEAFTVMGVTRRFINETAYAEIPKFWDEHNKSANSKLVCGMYGVCIDDAVDTSGFDYMIADNYLPWNEIPDGMTCRVIPRHTWAVFPCHGPMPTALQSVNTRIFSEWLPACRDYELSDSYNIELYSPVKDYPNGLDDENYYSEIWVPVKKK
jgi:Uncharacterized protein conserved in bacteria